MVRLAVAAALLLASASCSNAFFIAPPTRKAVLFRVPAGALVGSSSQLNAAEQEQPEAMEETIAEETRPEVTADEETASEDYEDSNDEQQEEEGKPKEDPEIAAIKQEIANLESALKAKEREISYQQEKVEEYSKAGYARKVAEMETMRRARSMMNSSSREAAVASILTKFLPVLDDFIVLENKYARDDFGKSFNALGGAMRTALKELGVTEYEVQVGEKVDKQRVIVVQEEYSDEFEKDTVIRPIEVGLELQGNVMRQAECVASLGSETQEEAAESEEEVEGDGDWEEQEASKVEEETKAEE